MEEASASNEGTRDGLGIGTEQPTFERSLWCVRIRDAVNVLAGLVLRLVSRGQDASE